MKFGRREDGVLGYLRNSAATLEFLPLTVYIIDTY